MKFITTAIALCALSTHAAGAATTEEPIATALTFDIPPYIENAGTDGLENAILSLSLDRSMDDFDYLQMGYDGVEAAIGKEVAEIALSVQVPTDGSYEKDGVYYSYPSWPFQNFAFTKTNDGINGNEPIQSIQDLDDYGPVFTWEGAVDVLGEEFRDIFSSSPKYRPIGNQTEQMDLFWSTDNAVIVIDRAIFLTYSETKINQDELSTKLVEHNLFDPITTFGVGFKSKDMRDQFNAGLAKMCERGDYLTLLAEYGVEQSEDEFNVICETATAGGTSSSTSSSAGSSTMRSFTSGRLLVVGIVSAMILLSPF